jgi:NADPH-dependent 7-cyano-7-deazaguanine reductase QueF-like protein
VTSHDKGPLLGRQVRGSETYDPGLLFPVPRDTARASLPMGRFEAFGEDVWHAYELSWLTPSGMPRMYLGTLRVPATSANIVESKSIKLYLNSLNNHRFVDADEARRTIEDDISTVAGGPCASSCMTSTPGNLPVPPSMPSVSTRWTLPFPGSPIRRFCVAPVRRPGSACAHT